MNGIFRKTSRTTLLVALILVASGTALAASGVGTLITSGDQGAATARGAQAPLGARSATPPISAVVPNTDNGGTKGDKGTGGSPTADNGGTKGDKGTGGNPTAENGTGNGAPAGTVRSGGGGGGHGGRLPFTGLLAIPVLLAGAALLGTGVVMRRRVQPTALSA